MALWRIGMVAWAHGHAHRADNYIAIQFPLTVCASCKPKCDVSDIVDNRGWRRIVKSLQARGFENPDRNSLRMVFEPLPRGTA